MDSSPFYSADTVAFSSVLKPRLITPLGPVTWLVGETTRVIEWAYKGDHEDLTPNVAIKYCDDGTITCGAPVTIATVAVNNNPAGCTPPSVGAPESSGCYVWDDAGAGNGVSNIRDEEVRVFVVDAGTPTAPNACSPVACGPDTRPIIATSNTAIEPCP